MWLESTWQDIRYAVRSHCKAPAFTLTVAATLALGIGASTAIFSMVNAIVLRPLPFPRPDRIVFISETMRANNISVSWMDFLDWRSRARSFESLAASRPDVFVRTGNGPAERLQGRHVTANFFRVLGVRPILGRDLTEADDAAGAAPVAIVSDEFWRTALGASPDAAGMTLTLDQRPYVVAGVLPAGFKYMQPYDLFVPMGPIQGLLYIRERADHAGYFAIGRLKDGVSVEAASADLGAIAADIARDHPESNGDIGAHVQPLLSRVVADLRLTLLVLFAAVGFLLLIACVNVANLLIARGATRRHELAVRAALGGGRLRIVRQLLVESVLMSGVGAVSGVALATILLRLLVATAPEGTPRLDEVALDRAALLFAVGAAALCGIVFGLFPALQASSIGGQELVVRGRSFGAAAGSHRLRRVLMAGELALALVLLTGAGLTARTLGWLTHVDAGFRSDHLLTVRTSFRGPRWNHDRRVAMLNAALDRIGTLPGVVDTAAVSALPIDGSDWNSPFVTADKPVPSRRAMPSSAFTIVSPRYFEAMGIRLVAGRTFTATDMRQTPLVIVINESLARRTWPGENAIGKRLKQGWPNPPTPWREVVGVVADVRFEGIAEEAPLQIYMPLAQEPTSDVAVVVRSAGPPEALQPAVLAAIQAIDRDVPVFRARTMERMLETSIGRERMSALVLGVFAFVALVLASVGLYGLVAHSVTVRTHEIGVRMALGASRSDVMSLVVRQVLSMAIAGVAIGLGGSLALAQSIRTLLVGIAPTDPVTFAGVIAVLLGVTTLACAVPAWQAARVDPTQALRAE
jgi:putative ABC transport system permease protein